MTDKVTLQAPGDAPAGHDPQALLRPPADIFEDADGITLHLDLPGVARERLAVHADRNTLSIDGAMQIATPSGMEALYAEINATRYHRSFALSGELDADRIEANLNDGVLTVRIPKRSELRPRKIEVKVV